MGECKSCMPKLPTAGELPLLSLCINTHNEGADLLATVKSVRGAYSGPLEVLVVDDAGTDDSAKHEQSASGIPELRAHHAAQSGGGAYDLTIIRNEERVGCGRAKVALTDAAKGDAILHMDGHCRVLRGDLEAMARLCAARPVILAPGVAPLHCDKAEVPAPLPSHCPECNGVLDHKGDDGHTMLVCTGGCGYAAELTYKGGATCYGGKIELTDKGCKVGPKWKPSTATSRRSATWYAVFMIGRKALERMGGWNAYPGGWGSQEIGLALRAWFAAVPVYTVRDVVCGHRYQADRHYKDWDTELSARGIKHYPTKKRETAANSVYAHAVVFDPQTVEQMWRPFWQERFGASRYDEAMTLLMDSRMAEQRDHFQKHCKRRTDEQFVKEFGALPLAGSGAVSPDDVTAVLLHYKRPVNGQKCVDALRNNGFRHIWQWCNGDIEPSEGVERVFRDSQNASTWARYCIAPLVETPYILFVDDDVELTRAGIIALLKGAHEYPDRNIGLIGVRYKSPYMSYKKRAFFKAEKIDAPEEVDMLWPKGEIMPREVACKIGPAAQPELWDSMRDAVGSTSGDDFVAVVAQVRAGVPPSLVVPSDGCPYEEHHSEGKEHALTKQPGRYKRKRAMFPSYRRDGWDPLECRANPYEARLASTRLLGTWIAQDPDEARAAFDVLAERKPNVLVEIGSCAGGTLNLYAGACAPGATIICIDDGTRKEARIRLKRVMARLAAEGFDAHWIRRDSHSPEALAELRELLGDRAIEALHIDGDHTLKGATQDWETFSPLVRTDGVVLLHDIGHHTTSCNVEELWARLMQTHKCADLSAPGRTRDERKAMKSTGAFRRPDNRHLGVGVVYL